LSNTQHHRYGNAEKVHARKETGDSASPTTFDAITFCGDAIPNNIALMKGSRGLSERMIGSASESVNVVDVTLDRKASIATFMSAKARRTVEVLSNLIEPSGKLFAVGVSSAF
jgi:hypothetical protein